MGTKPTDPARTARFEAFYRARFRPIAAYVQRRVPDADAPDVVARIFAVAWRRFDHLPPAPQDRLWLYGVARRTVSDHLRSGRRRARLHARLRHHAPRSGPAAPGTGREGGESLDAMVAEAIAALAPPDREVLQLLLWDDLSQAEAAVVLGCSVNVVEIRFRRARHRVRAALADHNVTGLHVEEPGRAAIDAAAPAGTIPVVQPRRAQP